MSRKYVLGIDLGTSSCKVRVVTAEGQSAGVGQAGYETFNPAPGHAEQRPEDWISAVQEAVPLAMQAAAIGGESIAAIGLTSAAHIGVLLDHEGVPVRPALLWHDQRSAAEAAELERLAGEEILRLSANRVSTSWTLPHLVRVREREPQIWSRVERIVLSKDYLSEWLTGQAVTDPGTAVSSQLYDVHAEAWSARLCELSGIEVGMLPEIRPMEALAGELTPGAASLLSLREGTPVINGALDSATELLAAGATEPGAAVVRLASAGGVQVVGHKAASDGRLITYPHINSPHWYRQAGTNTCATAVQWGKELFGRGLSWEEWDEAAFNVPPGAEGLLFHPYLAGERAPLWNPQLRGSFSGIGLHHGRGHFARAIYEGTALSIRHAMEVFGSSIANGAPLPVVGGGARSRVWLGILSGVLRRPLLAMPEADSSLGAGLIALKSLGLQASDETAGVKVSGPGDYERIYERYLAISEQTIRIL